MQFTSFYNLVFQSFQSLKKEEETLQQQLFSVEREKQRMAVWGEYDSDKIQQMREAGYIVGFYSCQTRNYQEEWEAEHNAFVIETLGTTTYFITVTNEPIAEIDAEPFKMSDLSTDELIKTVDSEKQSVETHAIELRQFAIDNCNNLQRFAKLLHDEISLDKVHINTQSVADEKIKVLEGYCPQDKCKQLDEMLTADNIYYQAHTPTEEDNVPVKLRNNWFTRLFEPLTGMYGMPVYQEFDPTPILAPFFLLFFAMCMGDAGYGILLILFGLGVKANMIKVDMFKGMGNIITVLGIGTLVVGFFLGTAFGIVMYTASWVPESVKNLMIKGEIAGFDIQMALAIAIGVLHITLAITIKAIGYTKRFGFMKNLSTWGWLTLILGALVTVILTLAGTISMDAAKVALIVVGAISALGIYLFNDPKRNIFMNIGAGLWDTYNMATGLLGDVLSYIRLYALGLAGGMLGGAFNTLGLMVLGDEPSFAMWIPFILILIVGHLLNLAMSVLGAFVHPLRLTFVEYFKNSGYEGKGEQYTPLAKQTEL